MRSIIFSTAAAAFCLAGQPAQGANLAEPERRWQTQTVEVVICDEHANNAVDKLCQPQTGSDARRSQRLLRQEAATVRNALATWNETFSDSIHLVEVKQATAGIVFRVSSRRSRCSTSHVGYRRDMPVNFISVGTRCNVAPGERTQQGSVLHEIMHAVGVYHEQERRDRSNYLMIDPARENLVRWGLACKRKKAKCEKGLRGIQSGAYDFSSIMHYSFQGYRGQHSRLTFTALDLLRREELLLAQVGQRHSLSDGDIAGVRSMYKRTGRPATGVSLQETAPY